MAVRAGRTEVVKVLIEHGAVVPAGMNTGLRDDELMLARWKAAPFGARQSATAPHGEAVIEEIQVGGCYGTSTDVLNAKCGGLSRMSRERSRLCCRSPQLRR